MLALRAVDPAQALADLTEISSQIQAAVLADAQGAVLASTFSDADKGERLARAAADLIAAAEKTRGKGSEDLVQLEAATGEGSLFVVRDEAHVAAAVTGADPTSGLVFYDLKTCLRLVGDDRAGDKKSRTRRRTPKKEGTGDEAA